MSADIPHAPAFRPPVSSGLLKAGYFTLEGLNSFATTYYFYYFYFFMSKAFGYGNRANLTLAALNGAVYAVVAWAAGRLAQRFGYFRALKLGFALMCAALLTGSQLRSAAGQITMMCLAVSGMCFTWPTLEALVSEGESRAGLQRMVGIYNVVWAATGALAYFVGGALLQTFGLGSLFFVPATIQAGQLALTFWLEAQTRRGIQTGARDGEAPVPGSPAESRAGSFLRMSWLANPFAYIAINTLVAMMPGVARRLDLSTMIAGFCCSLWCFARLAAFVGLWLWPGWHYRFRWLLAAYLTLVGSFAAILLAPSLAVLFPAQALFGAAVGLIYYSSLFYSMDLSDAKGEHGGIHEAVIGLGNCVGPAVGAASLCLLPQYAGSGAIAVTGLLVLGLGGLVALWRRG